MRGIGKQISILMIMVVLFFLTGCYQEEGVEIDGSGLRDIESNEGDSNANIDEKDIDEGKADLDELKIELKEIVLELRRIAITLDNINSKLSSGEISVVMRNPRIPLSSAKEFLSKKISNTISVHRSRIKYTQERVTTGVVAPSAVEYVEKELSKYVDMKRELNEIESISELYEFIERHNLEKMNKEMYEKWKYKQY